MNFFIMMQVNEVKPDKLGFILKGLAASAVAVLLPETSQTQVRVQARSAADPAAGAVQCPQPPAARLPNRAEAAARPRQPPTGTYGRRRQPSCPHTGQRWRGGRKGSGAGRGRQREKKKKNPQKRRALGKGAAIWSGTSSRRARS